MGFTKGIEPKVLSLGDIKKGMILKVKAASGSQYRKVYKVNTTIYPNGSYSDIWGIVLDFNSKENYFVETCSMVSNAVARFNKMYELIGGEWVEFKLRIV